jgi:excinuclease UvrABC helicase subunit UvrB
LDRARAAGALAQFELAPDDCARLFAEGTLYYYRYLRLFQLRDWPRAIRDTGRNLRVFDFIHEHARRAEDRNNLEKWRPYVLRMNGAAQALLRVEKGEPAAALAVLTRTQRKIEQLEELHDETFDFERERSLLALRELADQIQQSQPPSELDRLQSQLERAIADQEFERAARLRDRIRALNQTGRSPA